MGRIIKKQTLYLILFIACVAVPVLNIYEATFCVWAITVLITLRNKYSFTLLRFILCFVAIFLTAFIVSFFKEYKTYDFLRDMTYLAKPIMGFLIGYQLYKNYFKNAMGIIVTTGVLISIIHLISLAVTFFILNIRDIHQLRFYAGYFNDFEVYALIILIFHTKFGYVVSKNRLKMYVPLLAFSIFMYLARTNFIQFALLYMAIKGYFVINKRSIAVITSVTIAVLLGYAAIYAYNPNRGAKGFEAFLYKIKIAPIEPFKTKVNKDDWKDFNDNYRSYETILTIRQVRNQGPEAVIFGEGMGSSVDLNKEIWLLTSYMRYVPFLHNGFMTIFLKSGLTGVFFLIISIFLLFKNRKSDIPLVKNINYLFVGTGIYLIISYWVFMGLYFMVDTKAIILGFFIHYRENIIRLNGEVK